MKAKHLQRLNGLHSTARFTVPAAVASLVPADATFVPELVDEGILLRFVGMVPYDDVGPPVAPRGAPKWTQS